MSKWLKYPELKEAKNQKEPKLEGEEVKLGDLIIIRPKKSKELKSKNNKQKYGIILR